MIMQNCVAPKKEIFTRTPGAPQERFITFIMVDRELKCLVQTLQDLRSFVLLAHVHRGSFRAFAAMRGTGSCRIKRRVDIALSNLPSLSQVFEFRDFTKSRCLGLPADRLIKAFARLLLSSSARPVADTGPMTSPTTSCLSGDIYYTSKDLNLTGILRRKLAQGRP
jgi:hypothetical protein